MKKLPIAVVVLLAAVALAVPAQAQTCLAYVSFCDGIQIDSATDQKILAQWWNWDCVGSMGAMQGKSKADTWASPCGGNGDALIRCTVAGGCSLAPAAGTNIYVVLDLPLDNALDIAVGDYNTGACYLDDVAYTIGLGPCGGTAPDKGLRSQKQDRSSMQ